MAGTVHLVCFILLTVWGLGLGLGRGQGQEQGSFSHVSMFLAPGPPMLHA